MRLGITSYAFRYLCLDPVQSPNLTELVRCTAAQGVQGLQLCENLHLGARPAAEWKEAVDAAKDLGVRLALGTMTLSAAQLVRDLDRAITLPARTVRLILEREAGAPASEEAVVRLLDSVVPELESRGLALAIENHFDLPCSWLSRVIAPYPRARVGFCADVANSLRNWESPSQVLDLLLDRALQFHFKDFVVAGTNVGFSVRGVPFGQGSLPAASLLARVLELHPAPEIYVETWTPGTGDSLADIAEDARFLRESVAGFRRVMETLRPGLLSS